MQDEATNSAVVSAFGAAPKSVQSFIASGELEKTLASFKAELAIPESAMESVSNEVLFALLGVVEVEEIEEGLREEKDVPENIIESIAERTAAILERLVPEEYAQDDAPQAKPAPRTGSPAPALGLIATPAISKAPVLLPKPVPLPSAPVSPPPIKFSPPPAQTTTQAAHQPAPLPRPRTMAGDVEAVQTPAVAKPVPTPVATPMQPARPVVPVVPAMRSVAQSESAATVGDDIKKYGIDPYREPIA